MCNTNSSLRWHSAPAYVHARGYSTEIHKSHGSAFAPAYPQLLLYITVMSAAKEKAAERHKCSLSAATQRAASV